MKKEIKNILEKFNRYYEEIFTELTEELNDIIIEYKDLNDNKTETLVPILKSVNDCKTAIDFKAKLNIIKDNSFERLNKISEKMIAEDKVSFLNYLNIKTEDLFEFIYLNPQSRRDPKFANYKLKNEKGEIKEYFTDKESEDSKKVNRALYNKEIIKYVDVLNENIKEIRRDINKMMKVTETSINREYKSDITWEGTDTDLIELITALHEGGYINNRTENLSRKDAFNFFEFIFNQPLKDAESKLSKAIALRKDPTPFLDNLIKAFIQYRSRKLK